ncbi:thioesterase superfamily protein [Candidatus Omnitrophus magneticus]|uniref:Thioesterase superfamily protein n=1 Tax=Candidatus Omnitrophus magneticus TaxID=1609969 RepID=A0A0F0CPX0_9BACT|nr:thioesterase superfamily protein [Candidatus Omnitrophus magneticus]
MDSHTIDIRVRYADTDQMGVVYYSNYLVWFEIARTEFFRAIGMEYKKIEEERCIYLPVVEVYCRYKKPAKYDDNIFITTKVKEIGDSKIIFEYEIKKEDRIITIGNTTHVFINKEGKLIPIPEDIKQKLK